MCERVNDPTGQSSTEEKKKNFGRMNGRQTYTSTHAATHTDVHTS